MKMRSVAYGAAGRSLLESVGSGRGELAVLAYAAAITEGAVAAGAAMGAAIGGGVFSAPAAAGGAAMGAVVVTSSKFVDALVTSRLGISGPSDNWNFCETGDCAG